MRHRRRALSEPAKQSIMYGMLMRSLDNYLNLGTQQMIEMIDNDLIDYERIAGVHHQKDRHLDNAYDEMIRAPSSMITERIGFTVSTESSKDMVAQLGLDPQYVQDIKITQEPYRPGLMLDVKFFVPDTALANSAGINSTPPLAFRTEIYLEGKEPAPPPIIKTEYVEVPVVHDVPAVFADDDLYAAYLELMKITDGLPTHEQFVTALHKHLTIEGQAIGQISPARTDRIDQTNHKTKRVKKINR